MNRLWPTRGARTAFLAVALGSVLCASRGSAQALEASEAMASVATGSQQSKAEVSPPLGNTELSASEEEALAQLEAEFQQEPSFGGVAASRLQLYGFTDFSFSKVFVHPNSALRATFTDRSSFFVGNVNLYMRADLGERWNSLTEVRFTYMPNGTRSVTENGVERTNTQVTDYAVFGGTRTLGGIMLERAWLEYSAHSLLTIRAGQWLTPYGVWNVDHGSPTIIPVGRPHVISLGLLPERQVGLQLHGKVPLSDEWVGGYVLALSNGRGPIEYSDLDENKAVTARASALYRGLGTLELGMTGYFGKYTDLTQTAVGRGVGVKIVDQIVDQYDELSFGVDARWIHGGLHLQAEALSSQARFTDEGRRARTPRDFYPDHVDWGGYLLGGYRFAWGQLMPFVSLEYFRFLNDFEPNRPADHDVIVTTRAGINSRPTANVTLKAEFSAALFPGEHLTGAGFEYSLYAFQSQAAWAF